MCMIGNPRRFLFAKKPRVAWRIWRVHPGEVELRSLRIQRAWKNKYKRVQLSPRVSGATGLWAWNQRRYAELHMRRYGNVALGKVLLSGEMVRHTMGYRARRCEIVGIARVQGYRPRGVFRGLNVVGAVEKIAERYGVPVIE